MELLKLKAVSIANLIRMMFYGIQLLKKVGRTKIAGYLASSRILIKKVKT